MVFVQCLQASTAEEEVEEGWDSLLESHFLLGLYAGFFSIHNPATCLEGCLQFLFSRLFCSVLLSFPAKSVTFCKTLLLWIFIFSLLQPKVEVAFKQQTSYNKVNTKRQIEKLQKGKREVLEKWHFRKNWYPKEGDLSEINTSTSINFHFCVLNHCFFHRKHY